MTSLLAPSATGTVPAVEAVARVHAVLDEVAETEVGEVSGHDVAEVERGIARMEALKLRLVASAHRQGAAGRSGMSGTPAWLAAHTRAWGGKAAADVALATALHDSLPLTRRALATGALSTAHAAVIAETTRRLPAVLSDGERVKVESALVARARQVDPARLRRAARRALQAAERSAEEALVHEDGELRGEEARAAARVRLTLHDNLDGTVTGHFTVPTLAGAILRKAIQQMVSPRRRREVGEHARRREVREHARPREDWAGEQGAAFVELLEHLPTDRLHGKVAATVVVTVQHEHLRERARRRPSRHRARHLGGRGATSRVLGRHPARRSRRHLAPPRPRPHQTLLHRGAARGDGDDLRRVRSAGVRPPVRLVRPAP